MYKKDFIEVTGMKAHRKMRKMRVDPYPDAVLRRGLHRKEARETADPILEEAMMYSAMVGVELLEGLAIVHDAVDQSTLEVLERKVEVDGAIIQLRHQLRRTDDHIAIIDEWKEDVTEHMQDIGEAQGGIRGRLSEAELCLTQMQAVTVGMRREIDLLGGVLVRQSELLDIQRRLILEMDWEQRRRIERLERMMDLQGWTFGNLILIDLDLDEVMLVEGPGVVQNFVPINETLDSSDK